MAGDNEEIDKPQSVARKVRTEGTLFNEQTSIPTRADNSVLQDNEQLRIVYFLAILKMFIPDI